MVKFDFLAGTQSGMTMSCPKPAGADVHQPAANLNRLRVVEKKHNYLFGSAPLTLASFDNQGRCVLSRPRGFRRHLRLHTS